MIKEKVKCVIDNTPSYSYSSSSMLKGYRVNFIKGNWYEYYMIEDNFIVVSKENTPNGMDFLGHCKYDKKAFQKCFKTLEEIREDKLNKLDI